MWRNSSVAERIVVGRIGRAHGIRGEVTVEVRTDDPEGRFAPGARLATDPPSRGPLTVEYGHVHSGRLLLAFEGVTDRDAAERLRNTLLVVEVDPARLPDEPDAYYDHQLVGLAVVRPSGEPVGEVAEMLHLPGQDVIAIRRPDGQEALVPFVGAMVPEVDLAAGRLVVDPPPGLLDPDQAEVASPTPGRAASGDGPAADEPTADEPTADGSGG
jgi:16S rRNA processing protein RimM